MILLIINWQILTSKWVQGKSIWRHTFTDWVNFALFAFECIVLLFLFFSWRSFASFSLASDVVLYFYWWKRSSAFAAAALWSYRDSWANTYPRSIPQRAPGVDTILSSFPSSWDVKGAAIKHIFFVTHVVAPLLLKVLFVKTVQTKHINGWLILPIFHSGLAMVWAKLACIQFEWRIHLGFKIIFMCHYPAHVLSFHNRLCMR